MSKIQIQMVHDVVCSWCPIGYQNLTKFLKEEQLEDKVEITFLPFQLNPYLSTEGIKISDHLRERMGMSAERFEQYKIAVVEKAAEAGLVYDYDKRTHYFNTGDAHKLIHWAQKSGKQQEMNELLIRAYFEEGVDVGDQKALAALVAEIGMDTQEAEKIFDDPDLNREIEKKYSQVDALQVRSVPSFLVDGKNLFTGSEITPELKRHLSR